MGKAETFDHRISIGQSAQQQSQERIDNQKAQDRQQQRHPRASHDAPANMLNAAARDPVAPAYLFLQRVPLAGGPSLLVMRPPWTSSLGDRAAAGKVAESRGVAIINGKAFDTAMGYPGRISIRPPPIAVAALHNAKFVGRRCQGRLSL